MGKKEMWIGPIEEHYDQKFNRVTFPVADLDHLIPIKAYGKEFLVPANPEEYLEKIYGKNWRTLIKNNLIGMKINMGFAERII